MKKLPTFLHAFTLFSCLITLSGCNTADGFMKDIRYNDWGSSTNIAPGSKAANSETLLADGCPKAEIVPELGNLAEFTNNAKPGVKSLVSTAKINSIESKCTYSSQSVTVDIRLAFEGNLGPEGRSTGAKPYFAYPYFVAVTSPGGTILAKEVFAATMTYDSGSDTQTYFETMRQIIPIPSKQAGANFKVLAGFQLAPEQLDYNRAVIKADDIARREREKAQQEQTEAAQNAAQNTGASPAGIVVPDTMSPGDNPQPAQQLNTPINIAPIKK